MTPLTRPIIIFMAQRMHERTISDEADAGFLSGPTAYRLFLAP